ncbi:hypothetical protein RND81_12G025200 [Saponaria officinalis]|uniref:Small ubiquitin-related modifier n=1 Tax=Saponaria officinalis TaxID=3572 RepID=A0AAW1H5E1_SAPOF
MILLSWVHGWGGGSVTLSSHFPTFWGSILSVLISGLNNGGAHINLKVKGHDGNKVLFRALKKLMNAYCDRESVDPNFIPFLFDGRRLCADQTPDELEIEDDDELVAMQHQTEGY